MAPENKKNHCAPKTIKVVSYSKQYVYITGRARLVDCESKNTKISPKISPRLQAKIYQSVIFLPKIINIFKLLIIKMS